MDVKRGFNNSFGAFVCRLMRFEEALLSFYLALTWRGLTRSFSQNNQIREKNSSGWCRATFTARRSPLYVNVWVFENVCVGGSVLYPV